MTNNTTNLSCLAIHFKNHTIRDRTNIRRSSILLVIHEDREFLQVLAAVKLQAFSVSVVVGIFFYKSFRILKRDRIYECKTYYLQAACWLWHSWHQLYRPWWPA